MTAAAVIPFAIAAHRLRRRAEERREQALIAAMEAELDKQPVMAMGELIKRATARVDGEGGR